MFKNSSIIKTERNKEAENKMWAIKYWWYDSEMNFHKNQICNLKFPEVEQVADCLADNMRGMLNDGEIRDYQIEYYKEAVKC